MNAEEISQTSNNTVQSTTPIQELWLKYMTEDIAVIIYTVLVIALAVLTVSRSICFFRFAMTASTTLHNKMFDKIVYGTMRFFNTNPSGRILNRFSNDMNQVDEGLPATMLDAVQVSVNLV